MEKWRTWRKTFGARQEPTTNSTYRWHGGRIETVPLRWELTTPTIAPSLLPYIVSQPGRAEIRLILGVRTCYNHQWRKTKKTNKWRLACVQTFLRYFALVSIMHHWIMIHVYIQSLSLIACMVWVTWILNMYAEFDSDAFTSHHHLQLLVANSLCLNGHSEATDSRPSLSSFEKSLTKRQKRWILKL